MSWSYELLGDAERRLLDRLSVLRGGFGLDVAEQVAGGEPLAPQAIAACWPAWPTSRSCTVAALDEAMNLTAADADRFTETVMHHWRARLSATLGQLEAAETEVGLCWAAGRSGAIRLVEFLGPLAEARLAAARDDTATAAGALRQAADAGRRVGIVMLVPASLADLACMAAIAGDEATAAAAIGEARAALGARRRAVTSAALRYAEGIMAWHRGEAAASGPPPAGPP